MISQQNLPESQSTISSAEENALKFNHSIKTEAQSTTQMKKQVSLSLCPSSRTIQESIDYRLQNQIFAKYLMSPCEKERAKSCCKFIEVVKEQFNYICFLNYGGFSQQSATQKEKLWDHLISSWLLHMGYRTDKNKRYILSRVKMHIGSEHIHHFVKLYDNLHLITQDEVRRRQFLIDTCRNGWEYFVKEIVKYFQQINLGSSVQALSKDKVVESIFWQ